MNVLLTMSSFIFPLITFPYVSRVLGPSGTGKVSFATSVISYFTMFSNLGIPTYGIRACARVRDNKEELSRTVHELLMINVIMMAISYAALFIAILIVPKFQERRTLLILISSTIFLTAIGMEWMYKGLEQYTYITVRSVIFKFIAVIAMFLLIHTKDDYMWYGFTSILASSASNVFNFVHAHKFIIMHPVGNYHPTRHLKAVFVFFAMSVATTIYTNLDTVMVGFIKTDEDVGYYNAAVKIKNITVSIVTSLGTVLLPRASYYVEHGKMDDFKKITSKAINFVFLVATPMMLYFIFFAREGIFFLSGNQYAGAILPMQWIMPTLLFIGLSNILGIQILVPLGKEKIVLYSEIAGAITDFVINMLLIPRYASTGAAIGTTIAELVVLLWQYIYLRDKIKGVFKEIHYKWLLIALILASACSLWVKLLQFGSFLTLLISAILFFGIYGGIMMLFKEPLVMSIYNQVISKIKKKKS